jgi:hypothetical protein
MNNRIDAIYARQSVDKKDSISIENLVYCIIHFQQNDAE